MGVIFHVINYNLILYIGLAFYLLIFITFIVYQMHTRKLEIELFKQQQLSKSFERGKKEMQRQLTLLGRLVDAIQQKGKKCIKK